MCIREKITNKEGCALIIFLKWVQYPGRTHRQTAIGPLSVVRGNLLDDFLFVTARQDMRVHALCTPKVNVIHSISCHKSFEE